MNGTSKTDTLWPTLHRNRGNINQKKYKSASRNKDNKIHLTGNICVPRFCLIYPISASLHCYFKYIHHETLHTLRDKKQGGLCSLCHTKHYHTTLYLYMYFIERVAEMKLKVNEWTDIQYSSYQFLKSQIRWKERRDITYQWMYSQWSFLLSNKHPRCMAPVLFFYLDAILLFSDYCYWIGLFFSFFFSFLIDR